MPNNFDGMSFDDAMDLLEKKISQLEKDDGAGNQALYDEAMMLKDYCSKLLEAEKKDIINMAKNNNISLSSLGMDEDGNYTGYDEEEEDDGEDDDDDGSFSDDDDSFDYDEDDLIDLADEEDEDLFDEEEDDDYDDDEEEDNDEEDDDDDDDDDEGSNKKK